LTTIYVRIPRNRWMPIGEIELYRRGDPSFRPETVISKHPLVRLDAELLASVKRTADLLEEIDSYKVKHLKELKEPRHWQHLLQLRRERWRASPHHLLEERAKTPKAKPDKAAAEAAAHRTAEELRQTLGLPVRARKKAK
jgi:hypothetical protein